MSKSYTRKATFNRSTLKGVTVYTPVNKYAKRLNTRKRRYTLQELRKAIKNSNSNYATVLQAVTYKQQGNAGAGFKTIKL